MLIVSVDVETTGLDPKTCQVLEVGLVLWDTTDMVTPVRDLPTFHCYVAHESIEGEPHALAMNHEILGRIAKREPGYEYLRPREVGAAIRGFIQPHALSLVADHGFGPAELSPTGFNFDGFDRQFLTRLPDFTRGVRFHHRSLSPSTLWFRPEDVEIPGSDEVFRRAGVRVEGRHTALGDARGVIEALRAAFRGPGPRPVPSPRCPECGDRQGVRVPTDHGEWDDIPCKVCNLHDMFGFPAPRFSLVA